MNKALVKTGLKIPQAKSLMSSQSRFRTSSLSAANITQIWPPQKASGIIYSFSFSFKCISVSSWRLKQHKRFCIREQSNMYYWFQTSQRTSTSGAEYFTHKMHYISLSFKQTTATTENAESICIFSKEYLNDSKWVGKYVLNPLIIVLSSTETHTICYIFKGFISSFKEL